MDLLLRYKIQRKCKKAAKTKKIWKITYTWHFRPMGKATNRQSVGTYKVGPSVIFRFFLTF